MYGSKLGISKTITYSLMYYVTISDITATNTAPNGNFDATGVWNIPGVV